jgi:hypothetical protein
MALDHSCQVQRHTLAERGRDLYGTPPCAVEALLRVEKIPPVIWEPCVGRGNITKVLQAHGHTVISSDIVAYDFPLDFVGDFLEQRQPPADCILTNPPYQLCGRSAPFVQHALDLVPNVFLLLRLAFYESESRCEILESRGLRAIHVFRLRLPMMHRDEWAGRKANSGMSFGWFCWSRDHVGPTTINRISWER